MPNFMKNQVVDGETPSRSSRYYGNRNLFTGPSWENKVQSYEEVTEDPLSKFGPYLKPDWDGEGATPIPPVTLRNAQTFLNSLKQWLPNVPKVTATPGLDGSISLFWKTRDAYLYVHIYPDGDVVYYYKLGIPNPMEQEGLQEAPFNAQIVYKQLERAFRVLAKNTSYAPETNLARSSFKEVFLSYFPKIDFAILHSDSLNDPALQL
jgi:hypothetical protein